MTDPWEYHTIHVEVRSGAGARKSNKVIERMQKDDWEFVSQSAGSGAVGRPATTLMFRRQRGSSEKKPPVSHTQRSCFSSFALMVMAPFAAVLLWRRRGRFE